MTDQYFPCLSCMGLTVEQAIAYCRAIGDWDLQKHHAGDHTPFLADEMGLRVRNCEDFPPGIPVPSGGVVGAELDAS